MTGEVLSWPTRLPGSPYRWVLSLETEKPATRCVTHSEATDQLGVCPVCVSTWRRSLGVDPDEWTECAACGLPVHPTAEGPGVTTCPTCPATTINTHQETGS